MQHCSPREFHLLFAQSILSEGRDVSTPVMEPPVWKGMRIPMVTLRPDESPIDGAIRAASEHCDIEEVVENIRELERVSEVAPASLYLEDGQHALIYVLYAARPPPPGALEDADLTDEDDLYDWYTWPRAVNVLRHDARALATLRTLACAVANAVSQFLTRGSGLPTRRSSRRAC